MAQFIKTNWFNVISVLVILFTAVRSYTWNEANVKSLQSTVQEVKVAVTDLTGLVTTLTTSQAVHNEGINNLKDAVRELRERQRLRQNIP